MHKYVLCAVSVRLANLSEVSKLPESIMNGSRLPSDLAVSHGAILSEPPPRRFFPDICLPPLLIPLIQPSKLQRPRRRHYLPGPVPQRADTLGALIVRGG